MGNQAQGSMDETIAPATEVHATTMMFPRTKTSLHSLSIPEQPYPAAPLSSAKINDATKRSQTSMVASISIGWG